MAQPSLKASFFVTPDGVVIPKAPPIPRAKGGQNNPENLQMLCVSCNMSKGAK